jgi:hypothetical protein
MQPKAAFVALATIASLFPAATLAKDSDKGRAIVQNHCDHEVYLWSIADSADVKMTKVDAGGSYEETFQPNNNGGGMSIKISDKDSQDHVTQFEYTISDDENKVYYDLSNIDGYPFEKGGVTISPSDESCPVVKCPPGVSKCEEAYNKPDDDHATHGCPLSSDLELILCAGNSKPSSKKTVHRKMPRHPHARV